jgi:hypothetical protein
MKPALTPYQPQAARGTPEKPLGRTELLSAAAYCVILLWINVYVCRSLFTVQMAPMNSMHGFWAAIAQRADGGWFRADWWPYWDGGIPFEFTYSPLAPALTAMASAAFHISNILAVQYVSALAYCLVPLTLFLMAWLMTRSAGYSFLAGLFYSLTAPVQILTPDSGFSWKSFWDAHRLYLMAIWDDTPHVLALAFLPLAILFLSLSIRKRKPIYYAATAVTIAVAAMASAFGPTMVAMAALCLLFVLQREDYKRNILVTLGIGAYAYALSARFLPPSLLRAISTATTATRGEAGNWTIGSVTALAITILGWAVLWHYLPRWTRDWRLQFFALFAYLTSSAPMLATFLNRHLLPQPNRYKFEMELAWALLVVFAARCWIERAPRGLKFALLFLYLALAGEQLVSHRKYAKTIIQPGNFESTIEYRAALWANENLPAAPVLMPGSIAKWANLFAPVQQFTGSSWSMAYNPIQQLGSDAAYNGGDTPEQDARVSLGWLKAYGVGAVCMSGPKSPEYWKPYGHPTKFEGVLPVLWRADDTTIYQIPQRTASLAHVVPETAVVVSAPRGPADVAEIERYDAALDDPSLPAADFQWEGRNRIHIRTRAMPGQVITVQVSYHPGWHARGGDRHLQVRKDGLGLMWLRPECNGPCEVQLEYDGGWELRLCRWLSYLALAGLVGLPFLYLRSKREGTL